MPPIFSLERNASHKSQAELLRVLLSNQFMIAIGIIQDTRIKFVNQAMAELFGYSQEELMQWYLNDLVRAIHPEDRFFLKEQIRKKQTAVKNVLTPYSYRIITKSGEERWVEEHSMQVVYEGKTTEFITLIDITAYKQTDEAFKESECRYRLLEKELQESESKYVTLVEQAKDGLAIVQDGIVKFANQALAELLSLTVDELVGMPFIDLVAPESKELAAQRYKLRLAGKDVPSVYEIKLKGMDKSVKDVEVSVGIIQYQGDSATIAIVRDITMRKQIEEALRESEKKYRLLFDNAPIGIGIANTEDNIIAANQWLLQLTGYSFDELRTINVRAIYADPYDHNTFLNMVQTSGQVRDWEVKLKQKDGKVFLALLNTDLIELGEQRVLLTTVRDITARKRTETALKESEARLQAFFEAAENVAFIKTDLNGTNARILEFSLGAEHIFGYTREEVIGKRVAVLHLTEDVAQFPEVIAAMRQRKTGFSGESTLVRKSGETFPALFTTYPIFDSSDNMVATLGVSIDITERKQAEMALKQAKAELELRVEQRTNELRLANEQLRREINERKRTEAELYKLSQFLESIIDNTNVWLDVLDAKANVVIWNKAAEAISGYSREEVVGHEKVWEWLYPDEVYRAEVFAKATAIIERGEVDEDDLTTIQCKDGQLKIISWNSRNLVDENGTPIGSIAIGRDITERKRAEMAVQESEAQLRAQYKGIPIPTYTWQWIGDDFVLVDCNDAAEIITEGYAVNVTGKTAQEMFNDRSDVQEDLMRCFSEKTSIKREMQYWFKSGKSKDLAVSYVFVPPDLVMVHTEDITERKRAVEALRESEAKYSSLVENAKDGVIIVQDGVFQFANRAMAELSGYKVEKIVGKPFVDLVVPESRHLVSQKYFSRIASEKVPDRLETKIQCKDETIKDVELTASMITFHGLPAVTAIVRDITARKQAEEAKRDLEERRANFMQITSHELRTPLTVIKGYSEILAHKLGDLDDETKIQCFRAINRNVRRLERLITGVTTLGQLEKGIFHLEKTETDYYNFLTTALQPYQTRLGDQIEVQIIRERDHVCLEVDPDRILQVLDNLMENAIKHSHRDHRKIIVTSEIQPQIVRVQVTDNGAGISSEDLERIFEPFVSIPTKFSVGGTGIGLNLSRMIVEAHGGTLTAYSKGKGQGSTFVLELPKKRMG